MLHNGMLNISEILEKRKMWQTLDSFVKDVAWAKESLKRKTNRAKENGTKRKREESMGERELGETEKDQTEKEDDELSKYTDERPLRETEREKSEEKEEIKERELGETEKDQTEKEDDEPSKSTDERPLRETEREKSEEKEEIKERELGETEKDQTEKEDDEPSKSTGEEQDSSVETQCTEEDEDSKMNEDNNTPISVTVMDGVLSIEFASDINCGNIVAFEEVIVADESMQAVSVTDAVLGVNKQDNPVEYHAENSFPLQDDIDELQGCTTGQTKALQLRKMPRKAYGDQLSEEDFSDGDSYKPSSTDEDHEDDEDDEDDEDEPKQKRSFVKKRKIRVEDTPPQSPCHSPPSEDMVPETPHQSPSSDPIPLPSNENVINDSDLEEENTPSDVIRDCNLPGIYITKVIESCTTKTGKHKKNMRVFNSYQYCAICNKKVANFSQHLLDTKQNEGHAKSDDVQKIRLESNPTERKRLITLLRCKFNHANNLRVAGNKKGQLLLERRPKGETFNIDHYGPCPNCLAWTQMKLLWKHQKKCSAKPNISSTSALVTQSQTIANRISSEHKLLQKEVLAVMNRDEVGLVARGDDLILKLGCQWLEKNIGNKLKRGKYTSQIMRLCARLLMHLRKLKPLETASLWNYLTPDHFDVLVEATLLTAMPHMDDESELESPSNAIKLGHDIKRLINIKIGECIVMEDKKQRKQAESMLKLMMIHWGTKVAKLARVLLNERHFNKKTKLPSTEDLKKLNTFLANQLKSLDLKQEPTYEFFVEVVELVEAKLTVYNRRRSGELEATETKHYLARNAEGSNSSVMAQSTVLEKHLMKSQEVMEIRGKTGRGVPVIIPEEVMAPLRFIANEEVRSKVGINPKNPFLFAKFGNDRHKVVSCYEALRKQCKAAGLEQPEQITSTNLRKYMATFTQVLDLKPNQMEWVVNHLGHSMDIHKTYYRSTATEIEKSQVAKLLLIQDFGLQEKYANMSIEDIQLEEIVVDLHTTTEENSDGTSEQFKEVYQGISEFIEESNPDYLLEKAEEFFQEEEVQERKAPAQNRVKWSAEEEAEIKELFHRNFTTNVRPDAKLIRQKMKKSQSNKGLVHLRTVSALKNKVFRMIKP